MRIHDVFCYKKDTQESEFKKFLMAVHASNVEELPYYNVAVICNEECAKFNVQEVMEGKLHYVQRAFWFDTREKKAKGILNLKRANIIALLTSWGSLPYPIESKKIENVTFYCEEDVQNTYSLDNYSCCLTAP